jgi:hypothetical protein
MKPKDIKFYPSKRKFKKYMVTFTLNGEPYKIHFGDNRHEHFKDSTGLGTYSILDHNDPERKRRYYQRHGRTSDPTTAKYWSNKYLW